jgi:chromosome segregation ATPase
MEHLLALGVKPGD